MPCSNHKNSPEIPSASNARRGAGLVLILALISLAAPLPLRAEALPKDDKELAALRRDIAALQADVQRSRTEGSELRQQAGEIGSQLAETKVRLESAQQRLAKLAKEEESLARASEETSASLRRSNLAALVLLVSLVIEVVGALLLSGPALLAKQKEIFSLASTAPLVDLGTRDVNAEPRMNFLGSLGAFFLVSGFLGQFVGTLIGLGVSPAYGAALLIVALVPTGFLIYFLLGQSRDQSRREKIRLVFRSLWRIVRPRAWTAKLCDHCGRKLDSDDATVAWLKEPGSKGYEYLHPPSDWHLGHAKCLDDSDWYRNANGKPYESKQQAPLITFWKTNRVEIEQWWVGHNKSEFQRRGKRSADPEGQHAHEQEFTRFCARLRLLDAIRALKE